MASYMTKLWNFELNAIAICDNSFIKTYECYTLEKIEKWLTFPVLSIKSFLKSFTCSCPPFLKGVYKFNYCL